MPRKKKSENGIGLTSKVTKEFRVLLDRPLSADALRPLAEALTSGPAWTFTLHVDHEPASLLIRSEPCEG